MLVGRFNSAWIVLPLALLAGYAQAPAQTAAVAPAGQSQPGAPGKAIDLTQAAVPVPPGPVPAQEIKPAPPTPIAVKKVELGSDNTWDPQWDVVIEENLPPELLSDDVARDVRPFCPRYGSLPAADRRAFWAYFFQALAGAEAGLKPTANVRHSNAAVAVLDRVTHHIQRQQGLLQLAYQDADRYGCAFDWDADKSLPLRDPARSILDPGNNLLCGIRILKNQLIDLDEPLLTRKSYWSTLRPGTQSYKVFAEQMANVPQACEVRTDRPRKTAGPLLREAFASRSSGQSGSGLE